MRASIVSVVMVMLAGGSAAAETRAELQERGEALGREGKWADAITAFKAAEKLEHRATHACLIALAYTRKEAWPQAELFLAGCHEPTGERLPDWVPDADRQIAERSHNANLTKVTIDVRPAGTATTLTVSSFAPDEVFTPRPIHLPRGTHVIVGHAKGFADQEQIVIIDSATPRHVTIDFLTKPKAIASARASAARPLLIAGAIALVGAGVSYGAMAYEWNKLRAASSGAEFDTHDGLYKTTRITTVSLGVVGVGLVITGLIVRRTSGPSVVITPTDGGGVVSFGW